ncbi:hypothetical protein ASG87_01510 [Frateuria sp. Soil773]|uniref:DUF262 domain-containing protein n=1 Tax=Frateuria sp. Soil773 TaxID=1736407 RepID=UPI0006F62807|nr:DUF262 domain-containing protein [Frateuria sp. Soil773]KRE90841.1 hypothetical protein ASG87_01510 [Frateuria sp. Soil773]
MEANARHLERIFDQTIQYQIPLFQRPYVWTEERNWTPLWEDIEALLSKQLRGDKVHPHFLGAVVLEQLANPTGSIESRQVIDGQQRFTTLQLFLIAARDHAALQGLPKYSERLGDLVGNRRSKIDHDDEAFKVWPTNSDRAAFRLVHEAGSEAALKAALKSHPGLTSSNIVGAYRFFYAKLGQWLSGQLDDEEDEAALSVATGETRMEALWQTVKAALQVVVIDLDKNDETQVIFETLNARGEDLLPADLIKNFLFRRAVALGEDVEKLYEKYWQRFDQPFWREEIKQGRITRPRIDVFINYYLTLMTRDEVKSAHLFNAFKAFAETTASPEGSLIPVPTTPAEHIEQLSRYADVFEKFTRPGDHPRLALFLRRLEAVDTTTVYPILLHAYAELMPERRDEFDALLGVVESFLMRRMICGMTPKNYNRLFVDLIKAVERDSEVSAATVGAQLSKSLAITSKFPTNDELITAIFQMPLYGRLAQFKVRAILEALDTYEQHRKSEVLPLPDKLTIEHVMPQQWRDHWPLPAEVAADPVEAQKASGARDVLLNTLGNLTLITDSLNPALSNSAWSVKRPELLKFAKLNLTRYFHEPQADVWNEEAIRARTETLFLQLAKIWPAHTPVASA